MAVTGAIYNHLIFGGVDSADYGIYITGEAVYNAPSRAVDMITVPGRNGAVALDQGRFENIVVTYPAGTFGDNQADFRTTLSDFRNAILSQRGYQRLEDTYHPDEYRMGIYVEPIEVDPVNYGEAGKFTLSFNCKPQRFLTSGETAITVSDGDTVTNPTPYASEPLLAVDGYGDITMGDDTISVGYEELGNIVLINNTTIPNQSIIRFDKALVNSGDEIVVQNAIFTYQFEILTNNERWNALSATKTAGYDIDISTTLNGRFATMKIVVPSLDFVANSPILKQSTFSITYDIVELDGSAHTQGTKYTNQAWISLLFDGYQFGLSINPFSGINNVRTTVSVDTGVIRANSTVIANGTVYIDCETGLSYWYKDGDIQSADWFVSYGYNLPKLEPGANTIGLTEHITNLAITPRWWKL